jgi:hypothetical protein
MPRTLLSLLVGTSSLLSCFFLTAKTLPVNSSSMISKLRPRAEGASQARPNALPLSLLFSVDSFSRYFMRPASVGGDF